MGIRRDSFRGSKIFYGGKFEICGTGTNDGAEKKEWAAKSIGVDLGDSPGTCPPIIEKRPCIYHFLPPFSSNILVCPPNIFDKSTPVRVPKSSLRKGRFSGACGTDQRYTKTARIVETTYKDHSVNAVETRQLHGVLTSSSLKLSYFFAA